MLANYEFKGGRRLLIQGGAGLSKYIILLAESVIIRDKHMCYSLVDY